MTFEKTDDASETKNKNESAGPYYEPGNKVYIKSGSSSIQGLSTVKESSCTGTVTPSNSVTPSLSPLYKLIESAGASPIKEHTKIISQFLETYRHSCSTQHVE